MISNRMLKINQKVDYYVIYAPWIFTKDYFTNPNKYYFIFLLIMEHNKWISNHQKKYHGMPINPGPHISKL